jgi:hypothetical protein
MVINRCTCSGVIKQYTGRKYVFIRTCKAINEWIQQNIKAKRKIPILYCTANQLIKVEASFAFGYQIGAASKYYLLKMHNSTLFWYLYQSNLFPRSNWSSCITSIMHAGKRYYGTQFFGRKFTSRFSTSLTIRHRSHDWSCYWGSTVLPLLTYFCQVGFWELTIEIHNIL